MHKTLRRLPSLDFLRGFEAAGRRLSFTLAAEELFLTQSALSRQVKALEDALGQPLFERHHRALTLTPIGARLHREITDVLTALAGAIDSVQSTARAPGLAVSTTVSFASLWMIPRLSRFRARHPEVEVYVSADDRNVDLVRGEVDLAVRYLPDSAAPEGAVRLFGERMFPVVSPTLIRRGGTPLRRPGDLSRHVLLHLDDPEGRVPWVNWQSWLTSNGEPGLKPAGSLRLRLYDQVIQAAVGGQGVALGRIPMISQHLRDGRLVAPFPKRYDTARGYFVLVAPHAQGRANVSAFLDWLRAEAAAEVSETVRPARPSAADARAKGTKHAG
jgi:LysR family transcriptional regulator, glycine cleavage system transcriptional activator